MNCFYPAQDEHFASFICRKILLQGEEWSKAHHSNCFKADSNGSLQLVPGVSKISRYVELMGKSEATFFDNHTLFLLLVIYQQQRERLPVCPEDVSNPTGLYFCSSCMLDSVQSFGWAYLERSWAVPGVLACLKHKKRLVNLSSVYCGCHSLNGPGWFGDFLHGYCSRCKKYFWNTIQEDAEESDLSFARIIHNLYAANYATYKFSENQDLIQARNYPRSETGNDIFSYRMKNFVHAMETLCAEHFFPVQLVGTDIKELVDAEKTLIKLIDQKMFIKHGHKWALIEKIDGIAFGEEPLDYEMSLDPDIYAYHDIPLTNDNPKDTDRHNRYITDAHSRYLDMWTHKHGAIKSSLLAKLCHEQLKAVDLKKLPRNLRERLVEEELVENFESRFNKILEKYT